MNIKSIITRSLMICLLTLSVTSCALKLTDQTLSKAPYNAPLNRQAFSAVIKPPANHEIKAVTLESRGRLKPMVNTVGNQWDGDMIVPGCDGVLTYRYFVEYDTSSDSIGPFTNETFPKSGSYTRTITGATEGCNAEPNQLGHRFKVTGFNDTIDISVGDGICQDQASRCTLRAAIMESNAQPGLDLIELPKGIYKLTRKAAESFGTPDAGVGDLDITDSLIIRSMDECSYTMNDLFVLPTKQSTPENAYALRSDGFIRKAAITIDGNGIDRVFDIYDDKTAQTPVEVHINCIQVKGGYLSGSPNSGAQAIAQGAGIHNRATLLLDRTVIANNKIAGTGEGVGVYNDGELVARHSAIFNNYASDTNQNMVGTAGISGGGLYNNTLAKASFEHSLIARNSATKAGAIWNHGPQNTDKMKQSGLSEKSELTLFNTTITDNKTPAGTEISAVSIANYGQANIYWSTISEQLKALHTGFGSTSIANSIVVSQAEPACTSGGTATPLPARSSITSLGGNQFSGEACRPDPISKVDFITPFSESMKPLSYVGGFTPVVSASRTTPERYRNAIDFGTVLFPCPETDQRDILRPQNGDNRPSVKCDSGAYERHPVDP